MTSEVGKEISDIVRAVVQTVAEEDAQEVKEGEVVEEGDGDDTLGECTTYTFLFTWFCHCLYKLLHV